MPQPRKSKEDHDVVRVNVTLSREQYERLLGVAEKQQRKPTTLAAMFIAQQLDESDA